MLQGLITCGQCGLSYQWQYRTAIDRVYACRGRLRENHTDGSPRCNGPTLTTKWLENEVWMKISDILANPDKLREVIKESLGILKGRQAELDSISKPISEKLVDITDKKARLADQWVITNMDPSRLAELESINATLQYWQNQFQPSTMETESNGQGVQILEKTRPTIKIYGFEDIEPIENITSITAKREIMDRLQVHMVVFNDRIEIRCQIPIEQDKSIKVILNLVLPSTSKRQIKIKHPIL